MHILGMLFIILMLSPIAALGDSVGAWLFDRKYARRGCATEPETDQPEES